MENYIDSQASNWKDREKEREKEREDRRRGRDGEREGQREERKRDACALHGIAVLGPKPEF